MSPAAAIIGSTLVLGFGVGLGVGLAVGVGVGVGVEVALGLGVGVGLSVRVGVGVGVGSKMTVGEGVGVAELVGASTCTTTLARTPAAAACFGLPFPCPGWIDPAARRWSPTVAVCGTVTGLWNLPVRSLRINGIPLAEPSQVS